jgi:hypothetical protein
MPRPVDIWLAAGVRTPFAKVDGPLGADGRMGNVLLLEAA